MTDQQVLHLCSFNRIMVEPKVSRYIVED